MEATQAEGEECNAEKTLESCEDNDLPNFRCTLKPGHKGPHASHATPPDVDDEPVVTWDPEE